MTVGPSDLLIAAAVLAAAAWLLVRSIQRTGGGCHGCSGGCARRPPVDALVRLGRRAGERRR